MFGLLAGGRPYSDIEPIPLAVGVRTPAVDFWPWIAAVLGASLLLYFALMQGEVRRGRWRAKAFLLAVCIGLAPQAALAVGDAKAHAATEALEAGAGVGELRAYDKSEGAFSVVPTCTTFSRNLNAPATWVGADGKRAFGYVSVRRTGRACEMDIQVAPGFVPGNNVRL